MNVTVHDADIFLQTLVDDPPKLLRTAGYISADWARWQARAVAPPAAS